MSNPPVTASRRGPQRVLIVIGTRPEAIKLAPLVQSLRHRSEEVETYVCVTAQHRQMLDQVLEVFQIRPDYDLNVMTPGQTLPQITARMLSDLEPVLTELRPDLVVVQGDTTTTLCGALAAFYAGITVAHVEAGLRSGDLQHPFPEELNRILVSRLAGIHFAPTERAAEHLRSEKIPAASVHVTGNTGIDAILYIRHRLENGTLQPSYAWSLPSTDDKLLLITAHRRESFGEGFRQICAALREIADLPGVQMVYPVHPNPQIAGPVQEELAGIPNLHLIDPLDYVSFVDLMRRCYLLLTDSGGIQEEAPSLGKPVLVLREKTERPEAVEAGTALIVGTKTEAIVENVRWLLEDEAEYQRRTHIHNPFGDGHASERIADLLIERLWAGAVEFA